MELGKRNLEKVNYKVDFVITHTLPQSIVTSMYGKGCDIDKTSQYFDDLLDKRLKFNKWYAGHFHTEKDIFCDYRIHYHNIERIL